MMRVCHLSSAHQGLDVRIFHKECVSLAKAGYDTHLVIEASDRERVAAQDKNVTVHALDRPSSRFSRMIKQAWRCYRLGKEVDADIYHIHDPELIPYGAILALAGKKVIYDVHEDLPKDILSKDWIPLWARRLVAGVARGRYFFSVVTATPHIAARFQAINSRAVDIKNFPLPSELTSNAIDWSRKENQVCYVGGIEKIRGILELVQAMEQVRSGVRLQVGGTFSEPDVQARAHALPGWQRVDALGWLGRGEVHDVLQRSVAGLVTLHPVINYVDALPVKMFEYMAAGVPVIASHFPLWREIVEGNACGLCVDPLNPVAIARAIDWLVDHPQEAEKMGRNGRQAVLAKYNWTMEEAKLLALYEGLEKI